MDYNLMKFSFDSKWDKILNWVRRNVEKSVFEIPDLKMNPELPRIFKPFCESYWQALFFDLNFPDKK